MSKLTIGVACLMARYIILPLTCYFSVVHLISNHYARFMLLLGTAAQARVDKAL